MNAQISTAEIYVKTLIPAVLLTFLLLNGQPAMGHGPKGHGANEFTHLQAVKKGLVLYDKLIEKGKLNESWEIALADVQVYARTKSENNEIVVQFSRTEGEPRSVYIFFNAKGDYSGSNFSGE